MLWIIIILIIINIYLSQDTFCVYKDGIVKKDTTYIKKVNQDGTLGAFDECYYDNQANSACGDTCLDVDLQESTLTARECLDLEDKMKDYGVSCNDNNSSNSTDCVLYNICEYNKLSEGGLDMQRCTDKKMKFTPLINQDEPYECNYCESGGQVWNNDRCVNISDLNLNCNDNEYLKRTYNNIDDSLNPGTRPPDEYGYEYNCESCDLLDECEDPTSDNDILNKCYTDGTGEEYPNIPGYLNRSKCKICEPGDISSGNIKVRKTVNGQHRCVNLCPSNSEIRVHNISELEGEDASLRSSDEANTFSLEESDLIPYGPVDYVSCHCNNPTDISVKDDNINSDSYYQCSSSNLSAKIAYNDVHSLFTEEPQESPDLNQVAILTVYLFYDEFSYDEFSMTVNDVNNPESIFDLLNLTHWIFGKLSSYQNTAPRDVGPGGQYNNRDSLRDPKILYSLTVIKGCKKSRSTEEFDIHCCDNGNCTPYSPQQTCNGEYKINIKGTDELFDYEKVNSDLTRSVISLRGSGVPVCEQGSSIEHFSCPGNNYPREAGVIHDYNRSLDRLYTQNQLVDNSIKLCENNHIFDNSIQVKNFIESMLYNCDDQVGNLPYPLGKHVVSNVYGSLTEYFNPEQQFLEVSRFSSNDNYKCMTSDTKTEKIKKMYDKATNQYNTLMDYNVGGAYYNLFTRRLEKFAENTGQLPTRYDDSVASPQTNFSGEQVGGVPIEDYEFRRIVKGHLFGDAYGDFSENDSIYHIFSHLDKDTFLFKKGVKSNGVWSSGGAKYWYSVDIVDSEGDYDLDRNNKHDVVYYDDSYSDKYYCPTHDNCTSNQDDSNRWNMGNINHKLDIYDSNLIEFIKKNNNLIIDKSYYMNLDCPIVSDTIPTSPKPDGSIEYYDRISKNIDYRSYIDNPSSFNYLVDENDPNYEDYLYSKEMFSDSFQKTETGFTFENLIDYRNRIISKLIPNLEYFAHPLVQRYLGRDYIKYSRMTKLYKVILHGPIFKNKGLKLYIPCATGLP